MSNYGVKDIKTLEGIEAIRLRPGITSSEQCRIEKINAFLTSIHAYEKCEKQKGNFCNEPRCEYCVITLGNGYALICGKTVKLFAAARLLDRFKISNVCNGIRLTTGNRIFRFLDEENKIIIPETKVNQVQNNRITKTSRRVGAYDKGNNLIKEFDSLQLAAQFCGGNSSTISAVCRGKRNFHKNYIWRYLD